MLNKIFLALAAVSFPFSLAFAQIELGSFDGANPITFTGTESARPAVIPLPAAPAKAPGAITVLKTMPILDLMAERTLSSKELTLGTTVFLAAVALDDNWEVYFQIRRKDSSANPGVWKETALKDGVTYKFGGGELEIMEKDGFIGVTGAGGESVQTSMAELFELLYANSGKMTFDGLVTYAVIRNLTPLTCNEGTITLRLGSDGLYYYSLTPDAQVTGYPRWLLAINGVLYGLRTTDTDLVFVSKVIPQGVKTHIQKEKSFKF
ncbi:MAG: hypothetical protein KKH28_06300 [Elusimicrobia bacterium]|nr:hypothetical protein [Elusimicrobiota bacterium]